MHQGNSLSELDNIFSKYKCPACGRKLQVISGGGLIHKFDLEEETTNECANLIKGLNEHYQPFAINNRPLQDVINYLEHNAKKE